MTPGRDSSKNFGDRYRGYSSLRDLGADQWVRPHTKLESRRALSYVSAVERHPHATMIVELRGRRPIDLIRADHASAAVHERVSDPAIGIPISAHRQH